MEQVNPATAAGGDGGGGGGGGEGDWRSQIDNMARDVMVKQIMKTLKKHLPMIDPEGLSRLQNIAKEYEEQFFTTAPSQTSYSRKIAMLLLYVENPNQNRHHRAGLPPPQGNNPAESSGVPLMSQQEIRQGNTSTSVQAASLPSPGQTLSNISQTSALQNMSGQFSIPQMQLRATHSGTQSGIQQNPFNIAQQPILPLCQQPPQCVEGQQQNLQLSMHQQPYLQQGLLTQQPSIHLQQQSMGPQPKLHQNQLICEANSSVDMQQQQRLPVQSNNLLDLHHPNNVDTFMPHANTENSDNLEFASHNFPASLGLPGISTPSSGLQLDILGSNANTLVMRIGPEMETDTPFSRNEDILSDEVRNALGTDDPSSSFYNPCWSQGHDIIAQDRRRWNDQPFLPPSNAEEDGWLPSEDPNYVSMADGATNLKKRKLDDPHSLAPEWTFASTWGPQLYYPGT